MRATFTLFHSKRVWALFFLTILVSFSSTKSFAQLPDELRINMVKDAMTSDEIAIIFYDGGSEAFDDFDGLKITNPTINLSSRSSDGYDLAINVYNVFSQTVSIPLSVSSSSNGDFTLNFSGLPTFQILSSLVLHDAYTNQDITISEGMSYPFTIDNSNSATFGSNRFTLTFNAISPNLVSISTFAGTKIFNDNFLLWITTQQQNVKHFELEKSADGNNFTKLSQLNGAGTSICNLIYLGIDTKPAKGFNYYRIKTVFNNNASVYSGTININNGKPHKGHREGEFTEESVVSVYPNPCVNDLNVRLTDSYNSGARMQIVDLSGRVVYYQEVNADEYNVTLKPDLSLLIPGMYFLNIISMDGQYKECIKFSKAR